MTNLIEYKKPTRKLPTMVVAFAGWPDAAEAATRAIKYMIRKLDTEKIAEIDPEEYYDFTVNRPQTRINRKQQRIIKWPSNEFHMHLPKNAPDNGLLLYVGTEPNLKWKTFSNTLIQVAKNNGVELIVSLGSLLDAVPHTREIKITGRASNIELNKKAEWLGIKNSGYQGPTGIHTAFSEACNKNGIPHANIWSHCPHYVQTSPNPLASYALIERLKSLVDIDLSMNELSLSAEFFQAEITRAISKQPDVESYVSKLEARYDEVISTSNEMPTGVDMVQEIENFLRTQSNG
jgi:predicted ATP-grasp superfamily ATP-dependent carboligase